MEDENLIKKHLDKMNSMENMDDIAEPVRQVKRVRIVRDNKPDDTYAAVSTSTVMVILLALIASFWVVKIVSTPKPVKYDNPVIETRITPYGIQPNFYDDSYAFCIKRGLIEIEVVKFKKSDKSFITAKSDPFKGLPLANEKKSVPQDSKSIPSIIQPPSLPESNVKPPALSTPLPQVTNKPIPKPAPDEVVKLVGIIKGKEDIALIEIHKGSSTEYMQVSKGDTIKGKTVLKIEEDRVILKNGIIKMEN